jgi:CRP/FNR family transcriptional regulator, cyclic AMP receptor protein
VTLLYDPPVLDSLNERERAALLRVAVRRRFSPGEVVFHEGDPGDTLHIVTRGVFIARSSSTMGEMIAVNVHAEGDVFGELALLTADDRRSATVASVRHGATLMLSRGAFEDLRARVPEVDRFLLTVLAERTRTLTAHLVELLFTPVEQRVYRRLLAFSAAVGGEGDGWVLLSQAQLATLAGTTRSTTNRVLRRAEQRGRVELARGRMRVVDDAGLRDDAG